jgi:hypothetical protein
MGKNSIFNDDCDDNEIDAPVFEDSDLVDSDGSLVKLKQPL